VQVLPTSTHPGFHVEGTGKNSIFQFLPGKGLTTYFPSCCLRFQLLISLYVVADWNPLGSLRNLVGIPVVSPWLTPVVKNGPLASP